jgi:hypothetical protein
MQPRALTSSILCVAVASAIAVLASSQAAPNPSQKEMKQQFAEMVSKVSAPTAQHKQLSALVGDFDQAVEVRMGAGEPMKSHCIARGESIMGGRYVRIESRTAPEEELKGDRCTVYGYDAPARKFTMWSIDSMSTSAATAEGDYDEKTKSFSFSGEREGPDGKKFPFRWMLKIQDGGAYTQQILMKFTGSPEFVPVLTVENTPKKK